MILLNIVINYISKEKKTKLIEKNITSKFNKALTDIEIHYNDYKIEATENEIINEIIKKMYN